LTWRQQVRQSDDDAPRVTLSLLSVTPFKRITGGAQKRDQMTRNEVDINLKELAGDALRRARAYLTA
jgi:hypothetical protein